MEYHKDIASLIEASKKIESGKWFVEHAATDDGLSIIDDGKEFGMFPIKGEAYEIEFAAKCVNFVRNYILGSK
jgi:hypothetical protein